MIPSNGNVSLAWMNLHLNVSESSNLKAKKKIILRQLTGSCCIGTLTGLLGPSGAGKTSLLNVLSGKETSGLTDDSTIYGREKCPTSYYIPQHVNESMVGELTVGQILKYAYQFKNGLTTYSGLMEAFITGTLESLLLDGSILDRPFSVCSSGEQKRIAIAQELMSTKAPTFLFLDEPTTGLDSAAALEVISSLQSLARRHFITVIASIHAPNDETLRLFDQLYVLAKGGVAIYSGPPDNIQDWLKKELSMNIFAHQPPIEALIKVACQGNNDRAALKLANALLQRSPTRFDNLLLLPSGLSNYRKSFHFSHFSLQFFRFFRISFIAKWRSLLLTLLILTLYVSLLSTLFDSIRTSASGCAPLNQSTVIESAKSCLANLKLYDRTRENSTFFANLLSFVGIVTIGTSAATFGSLIKVFRSEHRNGWYSLGVFYMASFFVSLLQVSLYAFITGTFSYFLSGQHGADGYSLNWLRLGHYLFFMWLFLVYLQGCGHFFGLLLVDNADLAIFLSVIYYIGATMLNGFFLDTESNVLIQVSSSLLAFKFISWGILYTFYGLERCDWQREFSIVFLTFKFDPVSIRIFILRVFFSILAVCLLNAILFYWKFRSITRGKWRNRANLSIDERPKILQLTQDNLVENNILLGPLESEQANVQTEGKGNQFPGKILLAWRNLSLFASSTLFETGMQNEDNAKPILRNLSGQVYFGTLNALMGTSGAGKTSLLKVLNGRAKMRLSKETMFHLSRFSKIRTCFITQDVSGHLISGLTAKQMLTFASRLKNSEEGIDHEEIALRWLRELDLMQTRDTKVESCSGGEQKRLAVALELTSLEMPNCVCIDEPTSGLDSNSAEIVISVLYKLTRHHPIAILTSIHQPTNEILSQFDQLYVLARGGVAIYSGPPSGIQAHFTSVSCFPSSQYPIESLIKVSCSNYTDDTTVQKLVTLTNQQWSTEVSRNRTEADLDSQTIPLPDGISRNRTRFSLISVFLLLYRHSLIFRQHLWAEHFFYSSNYLIYGIMLPFLYEATIVQQTGCIDMEADFNRFCSNNLSALKDNFALLENIKYTYFANVCFLIFILLQFGISFLRELDLFRNEHRNGFYSSGSFYLAKVIFEVTTLLPTLLIYVAITGHWYQSIRPGIYWHLLLLFSLSTLAFQGLAHVVALLSRGSVTLLLTISATFFLFSQMLTNLFLYYPRLHYVYKFLSNFSIGRFFFEAVILLQYGFGRCTPSELQVTLYSMGLSDADYGKCLMGLLASILLYHGIAVYLLLSQVNPKENRRQRGARIEEFQRDMKHPLAKVGF